MKRIKSNKQLVIIGAGGHGRVVADAAAKMRKWKKILFLDDQSGIGNDFGINVAGTIEEFRKYITTADIFVALGNNATREKIVNLIEKAGANIPVIIHPNSTVGKNVTISKGTVVVAGVVINCGSKIGISCILNTSATIDHDNVIGDLVHISPGVHLAGSVSVGKSSWLGIGSSVSNNLTICGDAVIGAGAVVVKSINKSGTYVGVPARKLHK